MDISWDRVRSIFGYPPPPKEVWEKQFDYCDDDLQRLAKTPWEEIDFSDLWYYHHDLAYSDLQPEVFAYLFPVCLMDWHETLLQNTSCSHGDSEFHYGVHSGRIFEKMVTAEQYAEIVEFFRDSFLIRLDKERGFVYEGSKTPAYGWIQRLNSFGIILPEIDVLWNAWWSLDTPGRAVAAIQYCSGLMYYEGENPLFAKWTPEYGGGGPYLWENDSMFHSEGWMADNLKFLRETLNTTFVIDRMSVAAQLLKNEPECELARRVQGDLESRLEIIESRVQELPVLLDRRSPGGWSL